MRQEFDDLLCERYPKIFADRHRPLAGVRCMGLGFMCGDGWFELIDGLCRELQSATDTEAAPQVVALVVKEELGWLTFACRRPNDAQRAMIGKAVSRSAVICESCGRPGQRLTADHMIMTRCPEHAPQGAVPAR